MNTVKEKRNRSLDEKFLILAVIATNLSQLPDLVSLGITQVLNYPLWIVLLLYCIINKRIKIQISDLFIIGAIFLIVPIILLNTIFTNNNYLQSSLLSSLTISAFIYYIALFTGRITDMNVIKNICVAYVITSLIVSLSIFKNFFSNGIDLTSRVYAYASKNSISQIIFTSIVILMFVKWKNNSLIKNILRILSIVFQIILLVLLRSRATIIGFLICLIYIVITKNENKIVKRSVSFVLTLSILFLLFNKNAFDFIINNILLAGRGTSNLDSMTSGRISILETFPELIRGHWLTGIGSKYFECFPISSILQFGIVAGTIIIVVAYYPLMTAFKWRGYNEYTEIFLMLAIGYIFNSFFEGLAPVGPGVKCYFLWLLFGLLSNRYVVIDERC